MVPNRFSFPVENPQGDRLYFTAAHYNGGYHCVLNFVDLNYPCAFFVSGPLELPTVAAIVQHGREWPLVAALPESVLNNWLIALLKEAGLKVEASRTIIYTEE